LDGKRVRAYISADKKVLNPFSTLSITFDVEGKTFSVETLLKCDVLGDCRYCFTRDFRSLVLIKGRIEKTVETRWQNVLCWSGEPVFEEDYFERILITSELLVGEKERTTLLYRYSSILIEEQDGLHKVSIAERDKLIRYFTERLEKKW